jgi:hypothetical protein
MTRRDSAWNGVVVAATAVAWSGFFVHNVAEFGDQTVLTPDTFLPTWVWIAASVLWLVPATRTAGAWILLAWAVINLTGGAISVLPVSFLPFEPEQTEAGRRGVGGAISVRRSRVGTFVGAVPGRAPINYIDHRDRWAMLWAALVEIAP